MKIKIFLEVTPCLLSNSYRPKRLGPLAPEDEGTTILPKRQYPLSSRHILTFHKPLMSCVIAVRISSRKCDTGLNSCGLGCESVAVSCGLRRGSAAACLLGLQVLTPRGAWMSVSCEYCVLARAMDRFFVQRSHAECVCVCVRARARVT